MKNSRCSCLFAVLSFSSLLISSQFALAKTVGNYLSFEVLRTQISFQEKSSAKTEYNSGTASDAGFGFGLNYKHSYTFEEIFIAPGVFLEFNNSEVKMKTIDSGTAGDNRSLSVKNRYGATVDIGLDVTHNIAPYIVLGVANVAYETTDWSAKPSDAKTMSGNKIGGVFGAGIKIEYLKNSAFYFEWQSQNGFDAKTATSGGGGNGFETKVDVVKFGASYKF